MKTPREMYERQVELHDGRVVGSWSREWMAHCEAMAILRLRTKVLRHGYLLRVRERRGDASANALEALILEIWNSERSAKRRRG